MSGSPARHCAASAPCPGAGIHHSGGKLDDDERGQIESEARQSRAGENDGVDGLALREPAHARRHVAAQRHRSRLGREAAEQCARGAATRRRRACRRLSGSRPSSRGAWNSRRMSSQSAAVARGRMVRFTRPAGALVGRSFERMHDEIDLSVEERHLELFREEPFFDATREVGRRIDVAARGDDGDVGTPGGRGRRVAAAPRAPCATATARDRCRGCRCAAALTIRASRRR